MKRTMEFSISAVSYSEKLESERKYVIAKQFLRCSTSIGANVREAQEAESKADFIHKMSISLKEANETLYWIEICKRSENYPDPGTLFDSAEELKKILSAIVKSSKQNRKY
ncbi:MAG TPA: four helix bundle protein [Bacteroidia bacterium]|nr:four helix bundle protein [Bacteroidia bacterium]